jgi:hypothetical protein
VRTPRRRAVPPRRSTRAAPGPGRLGTAHLRLRQPPATPPTPVRVDRELGDGDELAMQRRCRRGLAWPHARQRRLLPLRPPGPARWGHSSPPSRRAGHLRRVQHRPRQAAISFGRLTGLDTDIACVGHGEPVTRGAAAQLRAAARQLDDHQQGDRRIRATRIAIPPVASRGRAGLHRMIIRPCLLLRH